MPGAPTPGGRFAPLKSGPPLPMLIVRAFGLPPGIPDAGRWNMSHGPDWGLLTLVNWLTAYAYFSISYRLRQRRLRRTHSHWTESVLFETFILACGTHHFVHPLALLLNAWWLQFVADAVMASVSLLAERVVTRNSQREFA